MKLEAALIGLVGVIIGAILATAKVCSYREYQIEYDEPLVLFLNNK
ncbi:hypothetical protein AAEU32_12815 [Pseudoalteromonas sp. SSDWG2]